MSDLLGSRREAVSGVYYGTLFVGDLYRERVLGVDRDVFPKTMPRRNGRASIALREVSSARDEAPTVRSRPVFDATYAVNTK